VKLRRDDWRSRLVSILTGEPPPYRRMTDNVEDRRGQSTLVDWSALIEPKKKPRIPRNPAATLYELKAINREAWKRKE
jgi:hypothetical protein